MPTDAELRDAAVVKLKQTTVGFKNKHWTIPPAGTNWAQALALLDQIGELPPPPQGHDLPVSITTLDPGEIAGWTACDSPTSLLWEPGSRDNHRIVKWADWGSGKPSFYSGGLMYAVMGFKLVQGFPNRTFNWHTQPNDSPDGWTAGGTACNAAAVSPVAFDITSSGIAFHLKCQKPGCANPSNRGPAAESWTVLNGSDLEARRNEWIWMWMELRWGNNYEAQGGGSVKVWLAEEAAPRVNISPVNTHWLREHQVTLWEGAYWSDGSPGTTKIETATTRLGRTPKEAYLDAPVVAIREGAANANGPGGSVAIGVPRKSTEAAIPAELRW